MIICSQIVVVVKRKEKSVTNTVSLVCLDDANHLRLHLHHLHHLHLHLYHHHHRAKLSFTSKLVHKILFLLLLFSLLLWKKLFLFLSFSVLINQLRMLEKKSVYMYTLTCNKYTSTIIGNNINADDRKKNGNKKRKNWRGLKLLCSNQRWEKKNFILGQVLLLENWSISGWTHRITGRTTSVVIDNRCCC